MTCELDLRLSFARNMKVSPTHVLKREDRWTILVSCGSLTGWSECRPFRSHTGR